MSEFLILKPVQVASRPHLSEQSSSEDDDVVSFAVSNAHITSPFWVFVSSLYDTTVTELKIAFSGVIIPTVNTNNNSSMISFNLAPILVLLYSLQYVYKAMFI